MGEYILAFAALRQLAKVRSTGKNKKKKTAKRACNLALRDVVQYLWIFCGDSRRFFPSIRVST